MKKIIFIIALLNLTTLLFGQEVEVNSRINNVEVFRNQAKESRTANVTISKGNTDIVLSGVTMSMIDASIQVGVKGEATLLSAYVRTNYFPITDWGPNETKANKLRDSIAEIDREIRWLFEERSLAEGEINMLNELLRPNPNDQQSVSPANITALADIYRGRFTELRKKLFDLQNKEEAIEKRRQKFNDQILTLAPKSKPSVKEVVLSFSAESEVNLQLRVSYLVSNAGWNPFYDINVANINSPVELTYNAKIFQSTGMDWKDVHVSISTSNPNLNNNRPILNPFYADYVQYKALGEGYINTSTNSAYFNMNSYQPGTDDAPTPQVIETSSELMVEFDIDAIQTIPADGREHVIKLKRHEIPAKYKYHAVPKLDNAAFLLARISNYGQYNLLPGQANIFFGENYVGQVNLNPTITADTLLISLGRDERVVIKRTTIDEKCSKKILSEKQKEVIAYEISVRNNKSAAIEIEILDQIPLSRRDEIVVKLEKDGGAKYLEKIGSLKWEFKLDPGKTKTLNFEYSVEYPEKTQVSVR